MGVTPVGRPRIAVPSKWAENRRKRSKSSGLFTVVFGVLAIAILMRSLPHPWHMTWVAATVVWWAWMVSLAIFGHSGRIGVGLAR
ncbi:MAG: hypothetical protein M1272_03880 [Firmicutes bacterium]|nr:hypothetical protein [Bacillota bacterium]